MFLHLFIRSQGVYDVTSRLAALGVGVGAVVMVGVCLRGGGLLTRGSAY